MGLWLLLLVGCGRTVVAPASWPASSCSASAPSPRSGDGEVGQRETWSLEMDDGVFIEVGLQLPEGVDCAPLVVEVPPGFEEGLPALENDQADMLLDSGAALVAFDPRGRGESEGEEDVNGRRGQADLAHVMRWAAAQDGVDADAVVLYSRSVGGALAAGALGRYGDLAPVAWVDVESPGWLREDMEHTSEHTRDRVQAYANEADDEDAWWAEREPAGLIGDVSVPYHRIQGWPDHAVDYMDAAVAMVNGAVSSPRVAYNGEIIAEPLTAESAREAAVNGGVDPVSELVSAAVLAAFGG